VQQVIPLIIYLQHLVFTFFRFSGIINCMLITFEKNISAHAPLMISFIKTEAAIFSMQAMLPGICPGS